VARAGYGYGGAEHGAEEEEHAGEDAIGHGLELLPREDDRAEDGDEDEDGGDFEGKQE
jgi:hypothetical protein